MSGRGRGRGGARLVAWPAWMIASLGVILVTAPGSWWIAAAALLAIGIAAAIRVGR